ncbi:unnamed protein product [Rhizoctonia solani]|uniref:Uncharacterized protein n=1 Tax=Rhizoctonia solani TaxID=456999 RepID=A0A8H3E0S4_9AGAM|nr:unnamed protein product [Rhizoctonia solani]
MLVGTDTLEQVPLVGFLDAYPEPAFILLSNTGPRPSLEFLYGNSSLRELLVHDESAILDDQTFFSAVASDEDIVWLSDPTQSGSQRTSHSVGDSHVINLRPAWLPRDHTSVDLELTPTAIDIPITLSNVGSSSRSYVFTASPRKAPMNFLRSENYSETRRRRDPGLRLPDFPLMPGAVGPHIRSRLSKSDSSSMLSQSAVIKPAELPTRLVDTFPWETTPLGARASWPVILELMVKYLMETPVSGALFWGWPHQVIIYNDEYARMIGNKHPKIFGKAGPVAWGELWDVLGGISENVRTGKSICKADDLLFFSTLTELQLPEEFYHSWHWTPVWQEDGEVAGIFNITWETTQKVIAERRLSCMSDLASRLSDAKTQQQFEERTLDALSRNPLDLPFVALYWCDVEEAPANGPPAAQAVSSRVLDYIRNPTTGALGVKLTLAGSIGIPDDHPIAPSTIKYTLNPLTFRPNLAPLDSGIDVGSVSDDTSRENVPGSPLSSASSTRHPPTPSSRSIELGLDLTKVFASGSIEIVDPLPLHLAQGLDGRGFKDVPRMAAIMPISTNTNQGGRSAHGRSLPCGILLIGLNTRRQYDADYASWLESVGSGLSNQLTVVLQREADMRMMEERERMDKAKTMFFTNVSHELRTPLTLIQAPLEQLLTSSNLSNDTQYKIQLAVRNSRRLKKLIDSIMDMSKLEAGRLVGNFRPVHLARVTADLAALFRSMAEKKAIDYRIDCDVSFEPPIYVDIDLWEKIVCNLLSNAFKYTPHGTITLMVKHEATVSFTSTSVDLWEKIVCNLLSNAFKYTPHGTITLMVKHEATVSHVSVSDTGKLIYMVCVGIPKQYIDQVFDRFFRVSTNTAEGTGVGLSLTKVCPSLLSRFRSAYCLANRSWFRFMEGPWVYSRALKKNIPGTRVARLRSRSLMDRVIFLRLSYTMLCTLVRTAVHEKKWISNWMELEQPTPSTTSTGDETEGGESATSSTLFFEKDDVILVVDDNADMRAYVRKIFSPYLTVFEAHDGVEALQVARSQRLNLVLWSQRLNLVLCDVMMPKMDGPELLRRMREERKTKLLPIIFVTASDDTSLFGGQTDGAVDYISKPFRVKDLLARAHLQLQLGKRRVKLEEDFEVRSHELQVLTDLSPVGIFRTDAEGRLMYANTAWYQIIGFPLRQDKDEWIEFVCPSSKEDMLYIWKACFESKRSLSKRVQWKNGCWTHVAISPLISPEGNMLGAFGAITDINEQHRAEEVRIALAEEREHMAATRAEEAEAQRQLEVERRRAQELLIDVTSHELRQPVSAIIQNAEVVRTNMKGLLDILHDCQRRKTYYSPTERMLAELEDDLQAMDSIKQCGLAQARIANDVLSLSRIQLNVLSIIPSDFDIRRETNQILIVFRNELMTKNIDFKLDLGRGADMYGLHTVTTDRSRYAQIITNLMSNAIRFTDTSTGLREIKVWLDLSFDPPSDDSCAIPPLLPKRMVRRKSGWDELDVYIYVSVQDSGPGLQKEDLALLFQRFQQGSNAHHVFGGSGLGLFVCRQLCHLMGGRIEVVSEPGQGATFRFFIRATAPGSGLGLFVCRQLCHLMGGRIEVVSEPGQGATFRFFIRATAPGSVISGPSVVGPRLKRSSSVQSKASRASRTSKTSKASGGSGKRPLPETPNQGYKQSLHVLITEDNKINQTVLARQMKRAGFTFTLASNGLEALQALEKTETHGGKRFDVILMDLEMPVLDGFDTTREIRRREEAGTFHRRNFIISITGNARSEQVQGARDAGVDDVIIKSSIKLVYANPVLRELLLGGDAPHVLDTQTFLSSIASDDDASWLSNPTGSGKPTGDFKSVNFCPTWLPRDHSPVDLELTPTPIDLPITIPGVGTTSQSFVFTSSPRHQPMNFLRSETRRRESSAAGKRRQKSPSSSSSWPSRPVPVVVNSADPPSKLIDTFDWENSPLGPRDKWPLGLKLIVKYLMEKPIPSSVLWGWPHLVIIYNDAYAKMIGPKHPKIFGQKGEDAWKEVWDSFTPVSDLIRSGKSTFKTDDQLFFNSLTELHLPEEVYHSWHWTPIWHEDGSVGGIWNTTWETTTKIIAERRLSCLSELVSKIADARTQQQLGERTLDVLARSPLDLPFIALYWCQTENPSPPNDKEKAPLALAYLRHQTSSMIYIKLTLAGSVGIPSGHPMAKEVVDYTLDPVTYRIVRGRSDSMSNTSLVSARPPMISPPNSFTSSSSHSSAGLDMSNVLTSGSIEIINPLPAHLAKDLDGRAFKDIPRTAAILPISSSSSPASLPRCLLIVGLNTRREYDAEYASWLESLSAAVSNQLSVVLQREADIQMVLERERMDKAKTMFFTNVSHELRTPLTLIQAPLDQLMALRNLGEGVTYKLQLATRNCKRLNKLIDSIMDMSKIEAGRLTGKFRPVQLGRLTADIAALFRSLAEKKRITYEIETGTGGLEPIVYVDLDLWEKIICNLLSNAFKYTTQGTVTVSVVHGPTESHVRVRDTGVGIPKDYLNQVFERFFRVNNNRAEGTGVGLSLTKELVSLHGGQILLDSRTKDEGEGDSGSVFTVVLPHGSSHLPVSLVQDAPWPSDMPGMLHKEMEYWTDFEQPVASSGGSGCDEGESGVSSTLFFEKNDVILVVDDNADMRGYIRKIFSPYLTVLEAQDGYEALQIAKSQKLHLVLCDVMMPEMDGPQLVSRLREDRKTKFLPVIFVTASDDETLFGGKEEGAVDHISKPFRVRDMLARVQLQLQLGKRRLKLEDEFEARSYELQVLGELSPVGIFRTDANGKLTYLNPAWYQITGFPMERERDEWLEYLDARTKEDALRVWKNCFENRQSSAVRLHWNNDVWTHAVIAPLISTGGILIGSFGAVMDINEQYRLEETRIALAEEREHIAASRAEDAERQRELEIERRRAQELLIDVTSHELRQPVSAIIQNAEVVRTNMKGLRELLQDCRKRGISYTPTDRFLRELDEDMQAMESITQCGLAQARIANDVLSLSRIQLNVLSIVPTDFDIRRETSQILLVFRNELIAKKIEFKLDLGRGADIFGLQIVSTDRSRFAQVITNASRVLLMSNAIRFTDTSTGLREILVSLELWPDPPSDESCAVPQLRPGHTLRALSPGSETEDPAVYIYVSVQDSGPGLRKEDLALLFQRFQQGSISWGEELRWLANQVILNAINPP